MTSCFPVSQLQCHTDAHLNDFVFKLGSMCVELLKGGNGGKNKASQLRFSTSSQVKSSQVKFVCLLCTFQLRQFKVFYVKIPNTMKKENKKHDDRAGRKTSLQNDCKEKKARLQFAHRSKDLYFCRNV